MAATLYLISRATPADEGPDGFVDGVSGVIINLDPATYATQAARAAEAVKALNATKSAAGTGEDLAGANQPTQFKSTYLNTEVVLGVPTGGVLATANVSIILQDIDEGGVSAVQAAVA